MKKFHLTLFPLPVTIPFLNCLFLPNFLNSYKTDSSFFLYLPSLTPWNLAFGSLLLKTFLNVLFFCGWLLWPFWIALSLDFHDTLVLSYPMEGVGKTSAGSSPSAFPQCSVPIWPVLRGFFLLFSSRLICWIHPIPAWVSPVGAPTHKAKKKRNIIELLQSLLIAPSWLKAVRGKDKV